MSTAMIAHTNFLSSDQNTLGLDLSTLMSPQESEIFSNFLDFSCGRYECSDVGSDLAGVLACGKMFLFISFVRGRASIRLTFYQPIARVCIRIPHFYWRKRVRNTDGIMNNSTSGCVDVSGDKIVLSGLLLHTLENHMDWASPRRALNLQIPR
jgi:hypothetical protein